MFKSAPKGNWTGTKPQKSGRPFEDNNKRKLFVASIGSDAREEDVRSMFRDYEVDSVFLKCEGEPRAHCFVTFATEAVMQEVLSNASKFCLNGRPVNIRNVTPRPENGISRTRGPSSSSPGDWADGSAAASHVGGAGRWSGGDTGGRERVRERREGFETLEDVHRLFAPFGIEKIVLKKPENSTKRPFAFVTLREVTSVAGAITQMNGHQFLGRKLTVMASNKGGAATPAGSAPPESPPWAQAPPPLERISAGVESWGNAPLAERRTSNVVQAPPPLETVPDAPAEVNCTSGGPPALEDGTEDSSETLSTSSDPITPTVPSEAGEERHEIYMGNLKQGITQAELEAMLHQYGVVNVSMKSKGTAVFAFVELATESGVQAAIQDLHGHLNADGKPMAVRKSNPAAKLKSKAPSASARVVPCLGPATTTQGAGTFLDNKNKVYIANLPKGTTKEDVKLLFSKYNTKDVLLVAKGVHPYAFVTLGSTAAFESAMQEMQGMDYKGSKLFVGLPHAKEWLPRDEVASYKAAKGVPSKEQHHAMLVVFNFPSNTTRSDIMELLSPWEPLEVQMGDMQSSPDAYTHAQVTVRNREAAEDAVLHLDESLFRGQLLGLVFLGK
ncbi:unnamed protein product [Ixodes hexagonus]